MSMLWQKESNSAEALYLNIFENVQRDHPNQFTSIGELQMLFKTIDIFGMRKYRKNDLQALNHRNEGNIKFQQGDWTGALHSYNQSLCFAKIGSENVSLAYANRSACFLHMKMYDKCLTDIELAKKAKYPQRLMGKLEKRQADCLKLKETTTRCEENAPKLSYPADENFPALANVLKIECSEEYGRHINAKCDIDVGQIILVEEAFISKSNGDEFSTCTVCLKTLDNFVACDECTNALFCKACAGNRSVHKIECDNMADTKSMSELFARFISFGLTAFPNVDEWMKFVEDAIEEKSKAAPTALNDTKSAYRAFLQLNIFISTERRDVFPAAYTSYEMVSLHKLVKKNFNTERKKRFLMHLTLHHWSIFGSNLFKEYGDEDHPDSSHCVFIIQSYFNHSCTPNIVVTKHGNRSVGKVLRPIKKGQQLFITYTGDYACQRSISYWASHLSKIFGFRCKCERCKPAKRVSTSARFQSNQKYMALEIELCMQPDLEVWNKEKLLVMQEKCMELLQQFGHLHWCEEMGQTMYGFARAFHQLARGGN